MTRAVGTSSGEAPPKGRNKAAAGLRIERVWTTPDVHPYDQVTWERRDARITNYATGAVAFEQLGVEVPSAWSANATNILAQKYFRGTLGTEEREWSRSLWSALSPYHTGVYVNFLMDEGVERVRTAYGPDKFARLQALKSHWDPGNFFRLNQNIPPQAA